MFFDHSHLPHQVVLENASNLRDLGGYPTVDGKLVRRGRVFRAPALFALTPQDDVTIAELGIKTTCDLRGVDESNSLPVILPGANRIKLPIEPTVGAGLKDILRHGMEEGHVSAGDMMGFLRQAYEAYAVQSFERYRELFALLLEEANLPLMLHCSAGKDRTGFGSALILTALGVRHESVVHDYLATNRLWRREIASQLELPEDVRRALLSAHQELLEAAFAAASKEYGTIDNYLDVAIGLNTEARHHLKHLLLD